MLILRLIVRSHDAYFDCRTNKCWTECFKIIDSVQHLLDFYFSRRTAKMENILIFAGQK